MFCALVNHYNNTDHIILQISCCKLNELIVTKDEEVIEISNCSYSFIISGGFEPGIYSITSQNQHVEFFIIQLGKELESGLIESTFTIEIDRYKYRIL
jgi:hypothetical protein